MRIGIDCRLSGPQHAGIGRYIFNLATRLPQAAPDISWVYFVADTSQFEELAGSVKNVEIIAAPIRHYSLAEQWRLPQIFLKANLDLLHIPHFNAPIFYPKPMVATIHDLLWHEYRGLHVTTLSPHLYWLKYLAYRLVASSTIYKAKKIFVPAQTIKNTLTTHYPQLGEKVLVTKEGVSHDFSNHKKTEAAQQLKLQLPVNKKILLYVGSLYPHKNLEVVLQALSTLSEYHLVVVGARNVFQAQVEQRANQLHVQDKTSFLGYLDDVVLHTIMQHAFALVQPSVSEGFGLTGIEAMAGGVPVIASNIAIFKEIYGSAATFFDPYSPADFATQLQTLASASRSEVIAAGRRQAAQYSWDTMTAETLAGYRLALKKI